MDGTAIITTDSDDSFCIQFGILESQSRESKGRMEPHTAHIKNPHSLVHKEAFYKSSFSQSRPQHTFSLKIPSECPDVVTNSVPFSIGRTPSEN
jgi:hypothetical protein